MSIWWDFVSRYMRQREMTRDQVAERGGFNKSRMSEWSKGASVTPKLARDTALAMNAPVLDAFVAAGYLQPEDTQAQVVERPLRSLSDDELLNEVIERMKGLRHDLEAAETARASAEAQAQEALRRGDDPERWAPGTAQWTAQYPRVDPGKNAKNAE